MDKELEVLKKNEKDNPANVEVVQLIRVTLKKGSGIFEDPVRLVNSYFDFDGNLVFTHDGQSEDD
ncbi:hypothetical protein ACQUEQ_08475 [Enterococcus casseliflavus]|uniref:hypothetical protein n=1 Tax=Enterococcus TaxID=1350 RepID=UPI002905281E|nr:hypothetical protein [Enterococcus gallinarum]MDU1390031.1 hypothetical protein [Bifidobacterium longum]MEB6041108.1 hypothetical protein [Enterococcus gallinarum]